MSAAALTTLGWSTMQFQADAATVAHKTIVVNYSLSMYMSVAGGTKTYVKLSSSHSATSNAKSPKNQMKQASNVPPYHPSLPSSVKGRIHEVKISKTLYETIVDSNNSGTASYIQFDRYNSDNGDWRTVWAGKAPKSANEPMVPYWYENNSTSIVAENDRSCLVTSVFFSTGDGTGSTADIFYVNPSDTKVRPVTTIVGLDPSVAAIDKTRSRILGVPVGEVAVGFTGYGGYVLSYDAAKNKMKKTSITNPATLLSLEADGTPYVMVIVHQNGTLSYQAENGATYLANKSDHLVVLSGTSVGFNLGLNPNLQLFSNMGNKTSPVMEDNAEMLHNLMIPSKMSGNSAFDVGIQNVNNTRGFLARLHISYGTDNHH